jgi:hypothetical protein
MDSIASRRLDSHSRLHLRRFAGQGAFLVLCCASALLIDGNAPVLFFSLLGMLARFTALCLFIAGLFSMRRAPRSGFGPWDHCLGFILLQLGCSIALHLIR